MTSVGEVESGGFDTYEHWRAGINVIPTVSSKMDFST